MNNNYDFMNYDIYSKRIGLFFNNKEKIGSYFGLFLTTLYILMTFVIFFILLIKTIERTDIRVYDSTFFSQDIPLIEINPNLIYFAFGLEDPITSNRFVDETIYYAKVVFFDRTKINGEFKTTYREELDYEICNETNFGENYQHLFVEGELNNSYCLKNYNLTLAGGYKYSRMTYFRIRLYPCRNKTENNNHCKPQEIIDYYFMGGFFSVLTKDIGLNPSNYSFPVVSTLKDLYTTLDKQIHRDYLLYFGITEIKTDTGLFFENIETQKYIEFRREAQTFSFREEKDYYGGKASCSVSFRLDDIIRIQLRTYTKLKEVLSSTGGYMQLISTIFTIISLISKQIIPEMKIINGIFNYNLKQQKMMMKIHSIKDFYSVNFPQKMNNYIYFPNNNIFTQKQKININVSNLSKNSLIGLENNNNDNNSSNLIGLNNKEDIFIQKRGSEKQNDISEDNSKSKEKTYKNERSKPHMNILSKFRISSNKLKNNNNNYDFNDRINFNLFQYYCFGKISNKSKEINMFNLSISFYKKRLDVINVFTFLLLLEKYIQFENHELNLFYNQIE